MAAPGFPSLVRELNQSLARLPQPPSAAFVYNPLDYAAANFLDYCRKYGHGRGGALMIGMNPGPWGMAQTGVPFGAVPMVRDWLGITGGVSGPAREHPKRPVTGLDCTRAEVSGMRLWGWARERFGKPKPFFDRFFVYNYCPLMFLDDGGRNVTPDKLPAMARQAMFEACDVALRRVIEVVKPRDLIGIGTFAEARARTIAPEGCRVHRILHPSPASPAANRNWSGTVTAQLAEAGLLP